MKKKMRKFSEGGFETAEGKSRIDEDTRARAMKSVEGLEGIKGADIADETGMVRGSIKRNEYGDLYDSEMKAPKAKTIAAVAPPTKPAIDMEAERARTEKMLKDQALIKVHPEDYVSPVGALKALLRKTVSMGANRTAKEVAESTAKNVTRRAEEGFNPSEALNALKPTRTATIKGKEIPIRQGKPNLGGSTDNMGVKEVVNKSGKKIPVKKPGMADDGGSGAFKRGGSVSSASRRADGCAIRGKTRA